MKKCVILLAFILLLGFVTATIEISGDENDRIINLDSISEAITTFLGLTDTPSSYTGQGTNCVKVNAGENALEFGACGGGGGMDYTNVAMTNISETWDNGLNITMGSGGWFKGLMNWTWLQNIPSYVKDWSLHFTHLSNFTDDILWTTGFNDTGDSKWLDDTTIGNCSVAGSCGNVAYMYYDNRGDFILSGDLNMTVGSNISSDSNLSFKAGQYGFFQYLWGSGSIFEVYEDSNGYLVMDFIPDSEVDNWIFRKSGIQVYTISSAGFVLNSPFSWSQGVSNPNIYQVQRSSDSPTWNLTIEAQKANAGCTGSNCDGADFWLSGGRGVGDGANGTTYILTGSEDHDGSIRIEINDTQNYIYGNTEFAGNITQTGGLKIYDNGTCTIFNRGGSNIMLCD